VGPAEFRTDTCSNTTTPRYINSQFEFQLTNELSATTPGLQLHIFVDEAKLGSGRNIEYHPVAQVSVDLRSVGKLVRDATKPGFLWLQFKPVSGGGGDSSVVCSMSHLNSTGVCFDV